MRLPGEQNSTKAITPARREKARYPANRATITCQGAVSDVGVACTVAGPLLAAAPIPNENAPATGWPSEDTTRQLTAYEPSGSWAGIGQVTVCPVTEGAGVFRVAPTESTRWMPSSTRLTDSVNVIVMVSGAASSRSPLAGSLETSSACADTGEAKSSAKTAASTAEIIPRRRPLLSDVISTPVSRSGTPGTATVPGFPMPV